MVHDRKKIECLIYEAKGLIGGLQDITEDLRSRAVQQEIMSSRIHKISDVRTLDWLSEVCAVDHPEFSDAASTEAEVGSEAGTLQPDIQRWKNTVPLDATDYDPDTSSVNTVIAHLEDMTVSELKAKISTYRLQAKEARLQARASQSRETLSKASTADDVADANRVNEQSQISKLMAANSDRELAEAEFKVNQDILTDMAEACLGHEFQEELSVITEWFGSLSRAEKTATFYYLGEDLTSDCDQTRFFACIQSHGSSLLLPPLEGSGESRTRVIRDQGNKDEAEEQ